MECEVEYDVGRILHVEIKRKKSKQLLNAIGLRSCNCDILEVEKNISNNDWER